VGIGDRHPLGSERLSGAQNPLPGLRDRDQSGAHRFILANETDRMAATRMDRVDAW